MKETGSPKPETHRYIYRTHGVCPREIHFRIQDEVLQEVTFMGGGCPGNARLVSRLLAGRHLDEIPRLLDGIPCRDDTSCPDQLLRALVAAREGTLRPAGSFVVQEEKGLRRRVGLMAHLCGDVETLKVSLSDMRDKGVEAVVCLGELTRGGGEDAAVLRSLMEEKVLAAHGPGDWDRAQGPDSRFLGVLGEQERDYFLGLPQAVIFNLAGRRAFGFFGEYLQGLPGFSDYEPFALEINTVCSLSRFLQDQEVFPALEAMAFQFQAQIIFFAQVKQWGRWRVGGIDFISLGPSRDREEVTWGLVEDAAGEVYFEVQRVL